jgi:HEAT repeat protein
VEIAGKPFDAWLKQLRDTDPGDRQEAIQVVLAQAHRPNGLETARKAFPELLRLATDRDVSVRTNAMIAIGALGVQDANQAKEVVPVLTRALADSQGAVRLQAVMALGNLGPQAAHTAINDLIQSLRDPSSWEIRRAAALALAQLGRDAEGAANPHVMNALSESLVDRATLVKVAVIRAIIQIGPTRNPQGTAAVKAALLRVVQDKDKAAQIWARVAVVRLDPTLMKEAYITPIAQALTSPDPSVRPQAADALGTLGELNPEVAKTKVPELLTALKNKDDPVTLFSAIVALGRIGPAAREAAPDLQALTADPTPGIREAATQSLARVQGSGAAGPLPGRPGG